MPLTIYRSSAGSGKTFTLVKEYLKLILRRPRDFQHILAITFTNKATEEMKSRVLKSLLEIAKGEATAMAAVLTDEFDGELTPKVIQLRAEEAYELIIHNYSRFEISTIDSFFSRVVRSFSRELDIPMSYELEMNTALALDEAVAQLFRSLGQQKELRLWLEQYTFEQIENDKSWNVEGNIQELGRNLFKEQFQEGFIHVDVTLARLTELVAEMKKVIDQYKRTMKAAARQAIKSIEEAGLGIDDFTGKSRGPVNTFFKVAEKEDFELNKTFLATANGEKSWYAKKSDKADQIEQLLAGSFGEAIDTLLKCVNNHERNYRTTLALFRNIYAFGLLEALNSNLKDYRDEQNIMLISDNNALIREIVRQDDAPFIFEKIGSFFKHVLIDEFQDTSNFQWNNLLPLVLNSLATGNEVLIVGDVKQSIYRFRGGNMRLLLEQVGKDLANFREVIHYKNLEENYRSLEGIVQFNNAFFDKLPKSLDRIEHVNDMAFVERAYEGHRQIPKQAAGGYVQVLLYQADESIDLSWKERALESLVTNIRENLKLGYDHSDILILVNRNGDMPDIAAHLLANDLPFVSERSLMLGNNDLIRFLIETLYFLQSEEDDIGLVNLTHLYRKMKGEQHLDHLIKRTYTAHDLAGLGLPERFLDNRRSLAQLPLFDLVEQLLLLFDFRAESDVFIQKFQDLLLEQTQKGIHSIHGFLEWWQEQGKDSTIAGNENTNAVKIMSVHKSKGLEAPIVMMPFADYSFLPNAKLHSFWTREVPEYLSDLSFVPLNYSKAGLINTDFEEAFLEETLESVMDSLNKTYVAFTRAREKLYVSGPHQTPKAHGSFHRINHFLEVILDDCELDIVKQEEDHLLKYEYQSNLPKTAEPEPGEEVTEMDTYPRASYIDHLSIRPDSDRFFMLQDTEGAENISMGHQVHEVLSLMANAFDAEAVIKQLLAEGTVFAKDVDKIKERVNRLMQHPQMQQWFAADYEVLTERELSYGGKLLRPDRVMVKGDEAIILDYKKEKKEAAHEAQVKRYVEAVNALGYAKTTGYIVYVDPVEIMEVLI